MRTGEILFEAQDVANLCPAPTINRLVVVPHAADVLMPCRQQAQPHVLCHVCILILVHQNIFEPALVLLQYVFVVLEDRHHVQQQVTEVAGVQLFQARLVLCIQFDAFVIIGTGICRWHFVRCQCAVLPPVNDVKKLTRRPAFVVDALGLHQLFEQA